MKTFDSQNKLCSQSVLVKILFEVYFYIVQNYFPKDIYENNDYFEDLGLVPLNTTPKWCTYV